MHNSLLLRAPHTLYRARILDVGIRVRLLLAGLLCRFSTHKSSPRLFLHRYCFLRHALIRLGPQVGRCSIVLHNVCLLSNLVAGWSVRRGCPGRHFLLGSTSQGPLDRSFHHSLRHYSSPRIVRITYIHCSIYSPYAGAAYTAFDHTRIFQLK
jgi:hypothetical protein